MQQALPAIQAGCSGAVVVAAGAVPSSLPLSSPSIFTVAGEDFVSPSLSVCPSISRGAHRRRWQNKTCARHGEDRGGRKRGGERDGAGGYHHGTRTTGVSCRRRLLRLWASVVVQDHTVRLPSGGPQLRVLSVSGAVRQCRAPEPAGRAAGGTEGTRGRRGAVEGENTTGAGKGSGRQGT